MKLKISKEVVPTQGVEDYQTRWVVKGDGVTRASTKTRDAARKFVKNHKAELKATQS